METVSVKSRPNTVPGSHHGRNSMGHVQSHKQDWTRRFLWVAMVILCGLWFGVAVTRLNWSRSLADSPRSRLASWSWLWPSLMSPPASTMSQVDVSDDATATDLTSIHGADSSRIASSRDDIPREAFYLSHEFFWGSTGSASRPLEANNHPRLLARSVSRAESRTRLERAILRTAVDAVLGDTASGFASGFGEDHGQWLTTLNGKEAEAIGSLAASLEQWLASPGSGSGAPEALLLSAIRSTSPGNGELMATGWNDRLGPVPNRFDHLMEPLLKRSGTGESLIGTSSSPNHREKGTVLSMAMMASNAYEVSPDTSAWYDVDGLRANISFGQGSRGLTGHVFVSDVADVVVIAFKGTSPWSPVRPDPSWEMDKFMDNLMFSCCCARVDFTWRTVCDCYSGYNGTTQTSLCNSPCLHDAVRVDESYYNSARKIFNQVRSIYPTADIWFTGHSLGGALAALMGITVGAPVIAFEAPGDRLYAKRLGFDLDGVDLSRLPIFHFGNVKDPIYLGKCTGSGSACYYAGYAMDSKCHLGNRCVYRHQNSNLDIQYHRIAKVITNIIVPTDLVPDCLPVLTDLPKMALHGDRDSDLDEIFDVPCRDCTDWTFLA